MSRYVLSALGALAALGVAASAQADETLSSRTVSPNGRPVQEIRFGAEPGSNQLRMVVVTNGPTAGTTTLLTAVGPPNLWYDPAQQPPPFTALIASGTVFSVGGGCRRGGQLDFPFINGNRPQMLRIQGGQPTIFPLPITNNENYDSADCAVAPDAVRTWFIYSNRTVNRLSVFEDFGQPNNLVTPLVNFSSVKTPFLGGLRPQISAVPGENARMTLMFMESDGETRYKLFGTEPINVDNDCLVGAQVPPPSAFTIPRGARLAANDVIGDFDNNGQFEYARIDRTPAACATLPAYTPAGPVAGTGFNWTEPAGVVSPERRYINFLYSQLLSRVGGAAPTSGPGPHAGNAGTFDACGMKGPEPFDVLFSATVESVNLIRLVRTLQTPQPPPPPGTPDIFRSGMESRDEISAWLCREFAQLYQ